MKATGVIRRLDSLGRLVIPKEIRKQYRLKEGDSVEFFVDEENRIIVRKFSLLSDQENNIASMCQILKEKLNTKVQFFYDDKLLSETDASIEEDRLSDQFLREVKEYHPVKLEHVLLWANNKEMINGYSIPVIVNGDYYGAFIIEEREPVLREEELEYVRLFTRFLIRQYEE